ncbi:MAG: PEGA domain-containing protein [Deltaproteobacteria bacterium]|nr:PEGA domain-containing protein [Deltaproteobacteria bacterium]
MRRGIVVAAVVGAAWLGASGSAPVRAQSAPTDDAGTLEAARARLRQGRAFFEQQNFEAAVVEFETAYRLRPHPTLLYNIGQCYERLFRYARARDSYERYVATAPPDDADRAAVQQRIAALDTVLGALEIRTNVASAQVWIDGRLEGTAPGTVRVDAGRHRVELRARGYLPEATQVEIAGRETERVALRLSRAGGGGVHPAVFFTAAGLAVAAAGTGAVLGVRALDLSDEYEGNPRRTREQQSEGETAAVLADVMFVGAGVMAVTAGVLLFVTDWGDDDEPPEAGAEPRARAPRVLPWVRGDAAGVSIGGVLP